MTKLRIKPKCDGFFTCCSDTTINGASGSATTVYGGLHKHACTVGVVFIVPSSAVWDFEPGEDARKEHAAQSVIAQIVTQAVSAERGSIVAYLRDYALREYQNGQDYEALSPTQKHYSARSSALFDGARAIELQNHRKREAE